MGITKADIKRLASDRSYDRGKEVYEADNITNMEKRGNILSAQVYGSHYEPYQITVKLDGDKIISTHCTCPYDWGGICKHTVAALLYYIQTPDQVMVRASMERADQRTQRREITPYIDQSSEVKPASVRLR